MDIRLLNELKKTDDAFVEARRREEPLEKLPQFFTAEELSYLQELKERAYSNKENLRFRQGSSESARRGESDVMAWPTEELNQELEVFFKKKLGERLDSKAKMKFAFHKNYHPYGLHTDAGYEPTEVIYKQGIVPLEIYPEGADTHTVIMKQRCYFSCSFPAKRQFRPEEREYSDELKKNWIGNYQVGKPMQEVGEYWFDNDLYKEWLEGFEIDHAFHWKIGDTIIWNRSQIHCSSDFDRFGLGYKVGLMWVSEL